MPAERPRDPEPPRRSAAIRTMPSDIAAFVRSRKPSMADIVAASSRTEPLQTPVRRSAPLVVIAIGLALIGAGGGLWILLRARIPPPAGSGHLAPPPAYLIAEGEREIANATDAEARTLLSEPSSSGRRLERLILRTPPGGLLGLARIAQLFGLPSALADLALAPPQLYQTDRGDTIIILEVRDPTSALALLIRGEPALIAGVARLAHAPPAAAAPSFTDLTYRNLDYRFAALPEGRGAAYLSFPPRRFIIIATSDGAMRLAIDRLLSA